MHLQTHRAFGEYRRNETSPDRRRMQHREFFFDYITQKICHDHLVGFFVFEESARTQIEKLVQNGIRSHQDKIPHGGWIDPRYRVFIVWKDIFKAKKLLGKVPLKD